MVKFKQAVRIFRTRNARGTGFVHVHVPFIPRAPGLVTAPRFTAPLHMMPQPLLPPDTVNNQHPPEHTDMDPTGLPKRSKHQQEQALVSDKWQSLRSSMRDRLIELAYPATFVCCLCQLKPGDNNIYRCNDCGPTAYFCHDCCKDQHRTSLHVVEQWNEEDHLFRKIWLHTVWQRPDGHKESCNTTVEIPIIVIDDKGRQHLQHVEFCRCEERAVTLIRYGLWPSSPSLPTVAFTLELMLTVRALVLEAQISLTSFCHGLQWYRSKMKEAEWYSDISRLLRWEVVLRFMELFHHISNLEFTPGVTKSTQCMACPQEENGRGKTVAIDGNFRLVHRRAAGTSFRNLLHEDKFFLPQHEVDAFVESHKPLPASKSKTCSTFQADTVIRTKNKTEKLDVTGVFGSVCKHDFPQKFLNMRYGERMAYPVFLISKFRNISILMYDIGCQMEAHLKRKDITIGYKIAIGAMHIYGHKMDCQLKYSPRRIEGAGMCDGEGTERLWSYIGRFSTISKEMTPENRQDILTEALLHCGYRLTLKLVVSLVQRLEKAYLLHDSSDKEVNSFLHLYPGTSREDIKKWANNMNSPRVEGIPPVEASDWKVEYSLVLLDFFQKSEKLETLQAEESEELQAEHNRLDAWLLREEKRQKNQRWAPDSAEFQNNISAACEKKRFEVLNEVREKVVEYTHMKRLRKPYSKGQGIAHRISKQTSSASSKLNEALIKYNAIPHYGSTIIPHQIERKEVVKEDTSLWTNLTPVTQDAMHIPENSKRHCMDSYHLQQRATEEIEMTKHDMAMFLQNVKTNINSMKEDIQSILSAEELSVLDLAKVAETKKHMSACEARFSFASKCFSRFSLPLTECIESVEGDLSEEAIPKEADSLSQESLKELLFDIKKLSVEVESDDEDDDAED